MNQDLRLAPKSRDTYAYFVYGLIKEPVLNEHDRFMLSVDPSLLETIRLARKDDDVRGSIEDGLRPLSGRLGENGDKTNAEFILQLIKEIIQLTNFEFTAMLAGEITTLASYSTPETLLIKIQEKGDSVISLEQLLRKELLGRGILQSAVIAVPEKTMPLETYAHVFELGLLRIILMLFDTFLVYSRPSKYKDQNKAGDLVSISLDLKASQEGDIRALASKELRNKGWNGIVQEYRIVKEGKKGFLGMGGGPNTYQISLKLFPMRVLPEVIDPKVVMDKKQINTYVNDLVKSILWSDGFLETGYLLNPPAI